MIYFGSRMSFSVFALQETASCKAKMVRENAYLHSKKECITIEKEWINNPQGGLYGFF